MGLRSFLRDRVRKILRTDLQRLGLDIPKNFQAPLNFRSGRSSVYRSVYSKVAAFVIDRQRQVVGEYHKKKHVHLLQRTKGAKRGEQLRISAARKDGHRPRRVITTFVVAVITRDDEMVAFQ